MTLDLRTLDLRTLVLRTLDLRTLGPKDPTTQRPRGHLDPCFTSPNRYFQLSCLIPLFFDLFPSWIDFGCQRPPRPPPLSRIPRSFSIFFLSWRPLLAQTAPKTPQDSHKIHRDLAKTRPRPLTTLQDVPRPAQEPPKTPEDPPRPPKSPQDLRL